MATRAISRRRYFRRARVHSKARFTLPMAIIAGFAPAAVGTIAGYKTYGINGALSELAKMFTGFDPYNPGLGFRFDSMKRGLVPVMAGMLIHKLAARLGVNRMLSSAGVPIIRV